MNFENADYEKSDLKVDVKTLIDESKRTLSNLIDKENDFNFTSLYSGEFIFIADKKNRWLFDVRQHQAAPVILNKKFQESPFIDGDKQVLVKFTYLFRTCMAFDFEKNTQSLLFKMYKLPCLNEEEVMTREPDYEFFVAPEIAEAIQTAINQLSQEERESMN